MSKPIKITESNPTTEQLMLNTFETRLIRVEDAIQEVRVDIAKINTRLDTELPHLATKADLADLRTEVNNNLATLKTELKTDNANLRTEIVKSHKKIIVWFVSLAITSGIFNSFISHYFHTNAATTSYSMQNQ